MIKIHVAIVDDEQLLVTLMKNFFEQTGLIEVDFVSNDGQLLLDYIQSAEYQSLDILLLDLRMKSMDGLEILKRVKILDPNIRVIIISSHYQDYSIGFMIKEGVSSFLPKGIFPNELLEIIQTTYKNGFYFTLNQIEILRQQISSKLSEPVVFHLTDIQLSVREIEVLKLLCYQKTAKEIGEELFIAQRTVEGHKNNLLSKLGVKNTVGLILYALQNNIVSLEEISNS